MFNNSNQPPKMCPKSTLLMYYGVISGPYFPVFELNTEIEYGNLRIQSEYRKIRTRNNSVFGHFSRSAGNASKNVLNETRQIIYFLYNAKGIAKKVYNNIINSLK